MQYKLVAIDLDGTLLDPYLSISPKNLAVIKSAIEKGTIITLSTGRMFAAALTFARLLQLDVPLITCNGAAIICSKSKKVFYERAIPRDLTMAIIDMVKQMNMELSLYTVDDIYVANKDHNHQIHRQIDSGEVKIARLEDIASNYDIIKILFSSEELHQQSEEIYRLFSNQCTFYFSLPWFVEIVAQGVDKGDALRELAGKLGVEQRQTIAIGDNFNDLPMIKYAGLGVAMGNAPSDLKNMADYVTRSCDDDGVAHVIEKFILSKQKAYTV